MKTKKQVISERPEFRTLINAVISRVGVESMSDIARRGIDAGFNGFIYYTDTHKFAITYRKHINLLLEETADEMGESIETMVAGFGIFRNNPIDKEDKRDLAMYIYGGKVSQGAITNVLAWFAAEEVARMFED